MIDEIIDKRIDERIDEKIEALKEDSLLTVPQAAKEAGVCKDTVYSWIEDGRMISYKLPGKKGRRVLKSELFDFIKENYGHNPKKKIENKIRSMDDWKKNRD